jgi:hypothetical protein
MADQTEIIPGGGYSGFRQSVKTAMAQVPPTPPTPIGDDQVFGVSFLFHAGLKWGVRGPRTHTPHPVSHCIESLFLNCERALNALLIWRGFSWFSFIGHV